MAIYFETNDPSKLLYEIKLAIDDGRIKAWLCDKDGDFTHTADIWKNRAWLRPKIQNGRLELFIIAPIRTNISSEVYAVFHGRFIEAVLIHCDKFFDNSIATAFPRGSDNVSHD